MPSLQCKCSLAATEWGAVIPERFVRALDGFEAVLVATPPNRWLSPSPCEGWCAVDVAGHVTAGLLVIEMRAAGRPLPQADPDWREVAGEDPVASWRTVRARMTAELGPGALGRRIGLATGQEVTLREFLEEYPLELLVHTWDLARATGQFGGVRCRSGGARAGDGEAVGAWGACGGSGRSRVRSFGGRR